MMKQAFAIVLSAVLLVIMSVTVFAEENHDGGAIYYEGNGVTVDA